MTFILVSVIVAIAASIGGLIAIYTKKEIEQFDKWIKYSEIALSILLAILMISVHKSVWPVLFLIVGAVFVILLNKSLFHIHLNRFIRALMFGFALGILFNINRDIAFPFAVILSLHNIIKGSRIGAYYLDKRKNIFKVIGNFQAIFIIATLLGFYVFSNQLLQAVVLNFAAGAVITTAIGTKI